MTRRTITHVDGVTKIKVKGKVIDGWFVCEYRFEGMTWGLTIPDQKIDHEIRITSNVKPDFLNRVDDFMVKRVKKL